MNQEFAPEIEVHIGAQMATTFHFEVVQRPDRSAYLRCQHCGQRMEHPSNERLIAHAHRHGVGPGLP